MENAQNKIDTTWGSAKLLLACIIVLFLALPATHAVADDAVAGIIDQPAASVGLSEKDRTKQVKKEQAALEKESRVKVKKKAESGERLAQVVLANDFAAEAQQLTFAPVAANTALSDSLRWYAIAAQRGYPGAISLDKAGVSFYPVRVVRNR